MATRRKPKTKPRAKAKKLKFELARSSVAGISVVVFCLFLWMFLLGVWAGQSLLLPAGGNGGIAAGKRVDSLGPLVIRAEKKVVKKTDQKK